MSEVTIRDQIAIDASINGVWEAVRDPTLHAQWHPYVEHIAGEHKLGARRRCAVMVGGKAGHTEERCAVYEEGRKILWVIEKDSSGFSRMVMDWTAAFVLESQGARSTVVTSQSTFKPRNVFVRLMMGIITRKFHQTQQLILGRLKQFAEKR
jgi:uncharacterized protein YndB with AHSA1/START domain